MGCGCNKKSAAPPRLPRNTTEAVQASSPKMYDVYDPEGALVASTANIVFARVESRRTGGTVVPRSTTSAPQS